MAITSPRVSSREGRIAPEAFYGDLDQLLKKGDPKPAFQQMIEWVRQIAEVLNILQRDFNASEFELRTEIATTSGTAHDFTSISNLAKEIVVMFEGVSLTGNDQIIVQLGDAGGFETSGYAGGLFDPGAQALYGGNGFELTTGGATGDVLHGALVLTLKDSANFTWVGVGNIGNSNSAARNSSTAGSKSLSSILTQVRITRDGGNTFDAGSVNILIKKSRS